MTRQPTPANILDAVLTADEPAVDRLALRRRLRWDYNQVSPTDRKAVEDAAVDILANGQRLQQSAVAIGERLIGVKRFLPHGLFGDWCATEFHMSQKTAENMMNVAREFGDKIETVSILTDSAMYMLAAPSTPEPSRQQAIEEAQQTGKSPTKSRVREIIAEHKPGPVPQPIPSPTAKEYGAAVQAAQPARAYWTPDAAPIPAGWDDADEAEYQALLPTWQKPGGEFYSINELDRITRRRVAERLSVERMDNLRFSLGERCRILWLEERRQERDASAISNQQSPISNPEAVDDSVLFDYEIDDALAELVRHANATLDGQIQSVFPGSAKYWSEQVSQTLQRPVTYQRMTLAMERLMRSLQEERAEQPGFVPIKMADDRIPRCRRLIGIYNQAISVEDEYGALTGCYSETTAPKRELQKLIDRLQRTIDLLEGKTTATAEECD